MSTSRIVGWVLSVLLVAFMLYSAVGKLFIDFPDKEAMFAKMGWTIELMRPIGYLEIVIALLFLIPQTAFLSAILLTAYLGGAIVTHVRVNEPWYFPFIIGVVVWIAYGLRNPALWRMAFPFAPEKA